jgi:glycosyltransferase involved in cell wall biosynthesis
VDALGAQPRRVLVLSSVRGGALVDLLDVLRRVPGWTAEIGGGQTAGAWSAARAAGGLSGWSARLRGLLYPLTVRLRTIDGGRPDAVVVTTNPFWLPVAPALWRRIPGQRRIVLVYDVFPDAFAAAGGMAVRNSIRAARWLLGALSSFATTVGLRRADAVVVLGARTAELLAGRHGLTLPFVIATGADPARFAVPPPDPGIAASLADRVVVSYVGNAGRMHEVASLGEGLAAALRARPDHLAVVVSARGERAAELLDPLRGVENVHLLPPLSEDDWRWVLHRTDVAAVALDQDAGNVSMPSKVHSALAAGCAILAVAPLESDLADLIEATSAGLIVAPGDAGRVRDMIVGLVDDRVELASFQEAALAAAERWAPAALASAWAEVLDGPDARAAGAR